MLTLLADMDTLLASDPHFLLGSWIHDARQWGSSAQETNLMEYNARNQVTLWGPEGQVEFHVLSLLQYLLRTRTLSKSLIVLHIIVRNKKER